jgi:hypothetical protein
VLHASLSIEIYSSVNKPNVLMQKIISKI